MYQRKIRRFRRRPKGRGHQHHGSGDQQTRLGSNSFANGQLRNNFRLPQSAGKLIEKYTSLAKEALSSGDKILSESYLQHADHFMRVVEEKNKNQNEEKSAASNIKPFENGSNLENIKGEKKE